MLQHDYLLEIIQQFVQTITNALHRALEEHDEVAIGEVESAIGELLQLDAETAMSLAPESLVTMMMLAGTGDAISGYVAYALNKLSVAYGAMGMEGLAEDRREQAEAVAEAFGSDVNEVPEELRALDEGLSS
jgi:hypothetical protein